MKLERVERLNLGLSAGAIAASFALASPQFATSVALGAGLEALNFGAIMRGARRFFAGDIQGANAWVGLFAFRFVLLAAAIYVLITLGAQPVALLIGLSIAMPAVLIDAWIHRPMPVDIEALPPIDTDDDSWDRYSVWWGAEIPRDPHVDGPDPRHDEEAQ